VLEDGARSEADVELLEVAVVGSTLDSTDPSGYCFLRVGLRRTTGVVVQLQEAWRSQPAPRRVGTRGRRRE